MRDFYKGTTKALTAGSIWNQGKRSQSSIGDFKPEWTMRKLVPLAEINTKTRHLTQLLVLSVVLRSRVQLQTIDTFLHKHAAL